MSVFINSYCEFVDDFSGRHIGDKIEHIKLDMEPEYKRTRLMYFDLIVLKS